MLLGTSSVPESCCHAAQERCGGELGEPGAMVATLAMPLAGAAGGFHLTWLKLLFLASLTPEEADYSQWPLLAASCRGKTDGPVSGAVC